MPWDVTPTVLTAIFGSTIVIFLLWGIHYRLVPHLRRPRTLLDTTVPLPHITNTIGPTSASANHHRLRSSLYSIPSNNFIDPRNSIADTELMSSRWSTSVRDLDPTPTSPRSLASPKSRRSGVVTPLELRSPLSPRPKSLVSVISPSPGLVLPRSPCINFHGVESIPDVLHSPKMRQDQGLSGHSAPARPVYRKRSQSDSLLERSYTALYGYEFNCKRDVSVTTGLSGTTLRSIGTPSLTPVSGQGTRSAVYTANTGKIRSPLPT